jgi:hypothetical protein
MSKEKGPGCDGHNPAPMSVAPSPNQRDNLNHVHAQSSTQGGDHYFFARLRYLLWGDGDSPADFFAAPCDFP